MGTNVQTSGVIPFLNMGNFCPATFVVFYIGLLSEEGEGWLFPKARDVSKKFDPHSKRETVYYEKNRKVGEHTLASMLPTLCSIVGKEKRTKSDRYIYSIKSLQFIYPSQDTKTRSVL